jgi:hypothetical protein
MAYPNFKIGLKMVSGPLGVKRSLNHWNAVSARLRTESTNFSLAIYEQCQHLHTSYHVKNVNPEIVK